VSIQDGYISQKVTTFKRYHFVTNKEICMKNIAFFILTFVCIAHISGCAKKEMVRSDETASHAITQTDQASPSDSQEHGESIVQEAIKEAAVREETTKDAAGAVPFADVLETVYFDFDSYTLSQAARRALHSNYKWLAKNPVFKTQIEGHCDERGSDHYNLALGELRAKAAMKYLLTLGVSADRLSINSYGEEKPAMIGHDETAWAKNRRAEFIIKTP
jgi:peptidoglycan-associated lipoprotein